MPIITPLSIDTDEEVASNSAGCRYCQAHTIRAAWKSSTMDNSIPMASTGTAAGTVSSHE